MSEETINKDGVDEKGKGENESSETTPQWKTLGYETEDEFVDKALEWQKKAEKVDGLSKTREKQTADYRSQSNEVGDLKKEVGNLQEYKRNAELHNIEKPEGQNESNEDFSNVLLGLDETKLKAIDEFLDKPENVELKKKVDAGGEAAMVECMRSYEEVAPRDLSKPLFQNWRQKQTEKVIPDTSSIKAAVFGAFRQVDSETRKQIPTSESGGMTAQESSQQKQTPTIDNVEANFFEAKKE